MTAPTLAYSDPQLRGSTAPTIPVSTTSTPAVGDKAVLVLMNSTSQNAATIVYSSGGADAGYTLDKSLDGTGTTRMKIWSKDLVSGDFSAGNLKSLTFSDWSAVGSNGIIFAVFRHANGLGPLFKSQDTTSASLGTGDYSIASSAGGFSDLPRAGAVIWGGVFASGVSTLQQKQDGAAAIDPQWDDVAISTTRQGGYKLYDTSDTGPSFLLTTGGNASKAISVLGYLVNQIIAVGTATETDSAFAITTTRAYTVGTATELDEAFPIHLPLSTLGTATETDQAFAIGYTKMFAVGTATETDSAFAIAQPLHFTFASETDEAFPIVWAKYREAELSLANPGDGPITYAILRVYAWKDSVSDAGDIRIALRQGSTDIAVSGWSTLTDSPTAIELPVTSGLSGLTDVRAWWQVRTSSNLVVNVSDVELELGTTVGTATETDSAFQLVPFGVHNILIGAASETDEAFSSTAIRAYTVGIASGTDSAFAIAFRRTRTIRPRVGRPHLVWTVKNPHLVWSVFAPRTVWKVKLMAVQLHEDTIEPLFCEVDTTLPDGTTIDPTGDVVEMALMADDSDPDVGDWVAGDWITNATTGKHYARVYFGPFSSKGVYGLFLRVTDDPAVPVKKVGLVDVI